MMSFFLVLQLVLSAVVGFAPTAAAATSNTNNYSTSIAKPNCSDHCGKVKIPFPFGLSDHCSLNSNFSITCNTSYNPPKPYVTNTTAEVKDITVEGQLSVMKPINKICYNQTGGVVSSFESWPTPPTFYLNQTANKFITVGCDTLALLIDYELRNQIEACRAFCDGLQEVKKGSCETGIGCCQTGTNNVARNAYVQVGSLQNYTNATDVVFPCSYAFVVQKEEFIFSSTMLTREWDVEKLPVVLDWIISNETCNTACQGNTTCVVAINNTASSKGYRCACKEGYEGNPYLSGCHDIDECEDGVKNNCSQHAICSNTEGGYECSCKKGYHGDGKGALGCISSHHRPLMLVSGLALSMIMLLIAGFSLYLEHRRRKSIRMKEKFFRENGGLILQQRIAQCSASSSATRIFTAKELEKATNNYDQTKIIGQGGFGIVYKGHLLDGRVVAVKRSKIMDPTQVEQFINEVIVLSQINHKNIVKLFGCCFETEVPLLVYEFINNGTLSEHIHNNKDKASTLPWSTRLRIATETAEVLSYLHSVASPPIIHRDVKSVNILLDNDYIAKVSDFGASRLVPQDQTQLTTMVQGTIGYLDPEYMQTYHLTEKSDVYSFGVVLVELLTSKKAIFFDSPELERNLSQRFLSLLKENQLFKILDRNIVCEGSTIEELQEVALLAKRCLNLKGEDRPTMKEVAMELSGLRRATKHPWANNSSTSKKSEPLVMETSIPLGYDHNFSATITGCDSIKDHMELPLAAGR